MSKNIAKKTHLNCNWVHKIKKDSFICCDARGSMHGKEMGIEEAMKAGCDFFHKNTKANELYGWIKDEILSN